jgi:protoporphyrinogen oxidase
MNETEYLIIGGGPTGLGAAARLQEKGLDWCLLEAADRFGGLASTHVDENGFSWDKGGHVQFSHYDTFDRYMEQALGKEGWLTHQRESWVWIRNRFVPYPFQNNLHRLDAQDRWACVEGLLEAASRQDHVRPADFGEWMLATFGPGITELFMHPYNFKVWAFPPSTMDFSWIGERVSVPKLGSVLKSICTGQDEISWGPNRVFRFPVKGGTGAVWQAIGEALPGERVSLGTAVERIDAAKKTVTTRDGATWKYRYLISTIPLNRLVEAAPGVVDAEVSGRLRYSSTTIVGIGLEGRVPDALRTKCWMYFPENNSPYYRVTVFSNYSPNNVARPGEQWSLMTETSGSAMKPVRQDSIIEEVLLALEEDGLMPDRGAVCSATKYHEAQGYPTPFLGRDAVVDPSLRAFEERGIFSRGRFGAWKYEVANQDHSFAQGYECVERLARGGGPDLEPTLFTPHVVNARRNP